MFCSCFLFSACDPSVDLDFQNLVGAPDFDEQDVSQSFNFNLYITWTL